jgi:hypothetical protein
MNSYRTGLNDSVGFRNHDERHRKFRRVIASGLHPAAARSYAELHTATSAFFLRDIVDRINTSCSDSVKSRHSEILAASIQDAIGRFIMRMTYGHIVVEDDPLLALVKRQVQLLLTGFAEHYWVNDFPFCKC